MRSLTKALNEWPCRALCKACFWVLLFYIGELYVFHCVFRFSPAGTDVHKWPWRSSLRELLWVHSSGSNRIGQKVSDSMFDSRIHNSYVIHSSTSSCPLNKST
jgi:hypothetical protein